VASLNALQLALSLNEGAKEMNAHSAEVRLRALDALVQAARDSSLLLAGFREVSLQMRRWSDDLAHHLEALRKLCAESVERESVLRTLARRRELLRVARQGSGTSGALLDDVIARSERDFAERLRDSQARLERTRTALEGLRQLGLMATVLSRTASIEATQATENERARLHLVAAGFGDHARAVLDLGKSLLPLITRASRELR